jgi:hypothetical protein
MADPIAKFREYTNGSRKSGAVRPIPDFDQKIEIGVVDRFKGKQEIRVAVVRHLDQWFVLIATYDNKDGAWVLVRWMLLEYPQIPDLLEGIDKAGILLQAIASTPADERPSLPHTTIQSPSSNGTTLLVQVDEFKGYFDAILTNIVTSTSARTGNWCKFGSFDIQTVIPMFVQAFDTITDSSPAIDSSEPEEPMAF